MDHKLLDELKYDGSYPIFEQTWKPEDIIIV